MSPVLNALIAASDQEIIKFDRWLICIGFLQLAVFAFQAWMLQRTVAGAAEASKDMKRSTDAMEKSAKAASVASENVVGNSGIFLANRRGSEFFLQFFSRN